MAVTTGRADEQTGEAEAVRLEPNPALRAMVLLGINCGFGNTDCATLPMSALSLDSGWLDYPRPKTGIGRRVPLWPETVAAIRRAIAVRPEPADHESSGLVVLTSIGTPWLRPSASYRSDQLTKRFIEVLQKLRMHRERFGFYTLRHVFRTVADAARDTPAVDLIMGHADHSMRDHYVERIEDDRLRAVTDHVRNWLFPTETPTDTA
jgi:integrase